MTIQERMSRDSVEDKIYFGELIEKMFQGEQGAFFKALCEDIEEKAVELSHRESSRLPADRYLGRIEAMKELKQYLVQVATTKRELLAEQKAAQRV